MGVNADFRADFSTFLDAIDKADLKLADFGKGAEKVEDQLNAMVDKFSGRALIQQASELTIAIDKIGGVSKLTAAELEQVGTKTNAAVEKLRVMGYEVPKGLQDLADATKDAANANEAYEKSWTATVAQWAAGISTGKIVADVIEAIAAAAWDAAKALPEIAIKGAEFGDVEQNFKNLTAQAGILGDTLLGRLREATHGTVNDFELMKLANKDLAAGMTLSQDQFAAMYKWAFDLSQATGVTLTEAIGKANNAMLTGRTAGLGRLENMVDLKNAEATYAEQLGTTAEHLTAAGKIEADRQAILAGMREEMGKLGEQTDGLDEHVAAARASWENFNLQLGKSIAQSPVLEAGYQGVRQALLDAFGGTPQEAIRRLTELINQGAIGLTNVADVAVDAGYYLYEGFKGAEVVLGNVVQALDVTYLGTLKVSQGIGKIREWDPTENKDKLAEWQASVNASIESTTQRILARGDALQRYKADESAATVVRDAAHASIDKIRTSMEAADASAATYTESQNRLATSVGAASGQIDRENALVGQSKAEQDAAAAAATKYAKAWDELNAGGEDLHATFAELEPQLAGLIEYYVRAGKSQADIATGLGVSATAVKAVAEAVKEQNQALRDQEQLQMKTTALWVQYYGTIEASSETATNKQITDVLRWGEQARAVVQKAGVDYSDYFAAIDAAEGARLDAVLAKTGQFTDARKRLLEANYHATYDDYIKYATAIDQADAHLTDEQKLRAEEIRIVKKQNLDKAQADFEASSAALVTTIGTWYKPVNQWGENLSETMRKAKGPMDEYGAAADDALNKKTKGGADNATAAMKELTGTIQIAANTAEAFFPSFQANSAAARGYMASGMTPGEAAYMASGHIIQLSANTGPWFSSSAVHRASGGPLAAGQPAIVGERGPELFVPSAPGTVVPGGGAVNVTVNVNGAMLTNANELARAVGAAFMALLKSQGTRLPVGVSGTSP